MTTAVTNSYITTTEAADALMALRLGTSSWTAAASATKIAALQHATSNIDALSFSGYKQSETQANQFPRMYQYEPGSYSPYVDTNIETNINGDCIELDTPADVLLACALEALALIEYYATSTAAKRKTLQDQGVKSYSIGPLSETFGGSGSATTGDLKSKEAYGLLEKYLENSVLIT
jgi:hypothetical protein